MELQQLRYAVAVAEERSFTRAAERCLVVQSALSHQIKSLERELGLILFARTSRRVETTAAGEAFVIAARASLEAADRARVDAAAAAGLVRGTLTIGMIPTVTAIDIPAALEIFRRAHPDVRIHLRTGGSEEFIAAIAAGDMDVAVLGLPETQPPTGVASRTIAREHLVAVVSSRHPLASRRRIRLDDLAWETFVDFPAGTPGRLPSDLAFAEHDVPRDVAFEAMNTTLILDLVRRNLVIALLSPAVVPQGDDLRTLAVSDGPTRIEYLAWSAFNPSPAAQAFLAVERGDAEG
ncbi:MULTISPECIES: LysR family transcriptional regulator [unclassified Microbacterium]|uniref:LysR family transcriptional regulator n=1 Tax=unclassified Microbacterium TaxID=2609290 RepID=UPI0012FB746F|nr:LysR family transcriptional regulator [Microbacterium sp. MAH-37]MVQ43040.1 LysR family transcriptional regulator [Microbacterium sp. MAH-37]